MDKSGKHGRTYCNRGLETQQPMCRDEFQFIERLIRRGAVFQLPQISFYPYLCFGINQMDELSQMKTLLSATHSLPPGSEDCNQVFVMSSCQLTEMSSVAMHWHILQVFKWCNIFPIVIAKYGLHLSP